MDWFIIGKQLVIHSIVIETDYVMQSWRVRYVHSTDGANRAENDESLSAISMDTDGLRNDQSIATMIPYRSPITSKSIY